MSISLIATRGFSNGSLIGSISDLVTVGYGIGSGSIWTDKVDQSTLWADESNKSTAWNDSSSVSTVWNDI